MPKWLCQLRQLDIIGGAFVPLLWLEFLQITLQIFLIVNLTILEWDT